MLSRYVRPLWALAVVILAMGASARPTSQTTPAITTPAPPTTGTLKRQRGINRQLIKPVNPRIGAALSTDTQLGYLYTSRPALIVGTFAAYDRATSTVTVKVDPNLSRFPNAMKVASKQYNVPADRVFARELRPERRFKLRAGTHLVDDTAPLELKPGQRTRPRPAIPIDAFRPGDKVTVSYRIEMKESSIPFAYNLSKVDPARTYFSADFDPTRGAVPRRPAGLTSGTLRGAGPKLPKRPLMNATPR